MERNYRMPENLVLRICVCFPGLELADKGYKGEKFNLSAPSA